MSDLRDRHGTVAPDRPDDVSHRAWEAFCLHVADGLSFADIGARLGVSANRARQLAYLADWHIRRQDDRAAWGHAPNGVVNSLRAHAQQTGDERFADPAVVATMGDRDLMRVRGLGKIGIAHLRRALGGAGIGPKPCPCCGGTGRVAPDFSQTAPCAKVEPIE